MEQTNSRRWGINGFTLKWIALITMAIDHIGMALFPQYTVLRIIGRLAFPIYCFLLVEGAVHTSNPQKYMGRLFLFALISEIPFNLICSGQVWYLGAQNVFFTLFLGLAAVLLLQKWGVKMQSVVLIIALILIAQYAGMDYGGGGVLIIVFFYLYRTQLWVKSAGFAAITVGVYGGLQNYAILSLIPILCYSGKRGPGMKYFFYLFYPAHLLVLYWLKSRM